MTTALQPDSHNSQKSGKSKRFKPTPNVSTSSDLSLSILNNCLDSLLYQDGKRRPLTHNTLKLIEDAKSKVGEANALFLKGLISSADRFELLSTAEGKGCEHPIMYYFLGAFYSRGVGKSESKAIEYCDKAIAGM